MFGWSQGLGNVKAVARKKWFPERRENRALLVYTSTTAPLVVSKVLPPPESGLPQVLGVWEQRRGSLRLTALPPGSPIQPPDSTAIPTRCASRLRLLLWKIHSGFRPKVAVARSGQQGKRRGRRHQAPGRTAAVQPAAPVAAAKPARTAPEARAHTCSGFSLPAGQRPLPGRVPGATGPPRGLRVQLPHGGPTHLRGRRYRNWDRSPEAWPSHSAPPRRPGDSSR